MAKPKKSTEPANMPKCYKPVSGMKYQIIGRTHKAKEWEHVDHARDAQDRDYLLVEYALAFGKGWEFKVLQLPGECWKIEFNNPLLPGNN